MDDSTDEIVQLVKLIAKALVDKPEEVSVRAVEGEQVKVLELSVADGAKAPSHPRPSRA